MKTECDEKNLHFVNCAIDMSWKITVVRTVKIYILFIHEKHQTASDVRRILCDDNCYCRREKIPDITWNIVNYNEHFDQLD